MELAKNTVFWPYFLLFSFIIFQVLSPDIDKLAKIKNHAKIIKIKINL